MTVPEDRRESVLGEVPRQTHGEEIRVFPLFLSLGVVTVRWKATLTLGVVTVPLEGDSSEYVNALRPSPMVCGRGYSDRLSLWLSGAPQISEQQG